MTDGLGGAVAESHWHEPRVRRMAVEATVDGGRRQRSQRFTAQSGDGGDGQGEECRERCERVAGQADD